MKQTCIPHLHRVTYRFIFDFSPSPRYLLSLITLGVSGDPTRSALFALHFLFMLRGWERILSGHARAPFALEKLSTPALFPMHRSEMLGNSASPILNADSRSFGADPSGSLALACLTTHQVPLPSRRSSSGILGRKMETLAEWSFI